MKSPWSSSHASTASCSGGGGQLRSILRASSQPPRYLLLPLLSVLSPFPAFLLLLAVPPARREMEGTDSHLPPSPRSQVCGRQEAWCPAPAPRRRHLSASPAPPPVPPRPAGSTSTAAPQRPGGLPRPGSAPASPSVGDTGGSPRSRRCPLQRRGRAGGRRRWRGARRLPCARANLGRFGPGGPSGLGQKRKAMKK